MTFDNQTRRQYAQNFLIDRKFVRSLVNKAQFGPTDLVLEIGPGSGIITRELAQTAGQVQAIEIDRNLIPELQKSLSDCPNVEIVAGDILKIPLPDKPFSIFSNIPFNITSPIMQKFLWAKNPPQEAWLIMQQEAADKFIGEGASTESSVLFQPWFTFHQAAHINRFEFRPVPSVHASLLHMVARQRPLLEEKHKKTYYQFVSFGFRTWKKNLKIGFKNVFTYSQWKRLAHDNKFAIESKPNELSLEQWLAIFRYFLIGVADEKKQLIMRYQPHEAIEGERQKPRNKKRRDTNRRPKKS